MKYELRFNITHCKYVNDGRESDIYPIFEFNYDLNEVKYFMSETGYYNPKSSRLATDPIPDHIKSLFWWEE